MSDFEKKVSREIQKTGLPTEIKATKILQDNGWSVFNEYPYLDREENKIRTLDIKATKGFLKSEKAKANGSYEIDSDCELFIECKKSVKQSWVFHTPSLSESVIDFSIKRIGYDMTFDLSKEIAKIFAKTNELAETEDHKKERSSIFSKIPLTLKKMEYQIATTHQVVFGGKDDFNEATMQVLKALLHKDEEDKLAHSEPSYQHRVIPMVLFDGTIFKCYYGLNGELLTPKIEYVRYLAHGLPNQKIPALIDVMTINYFPKYLKLIEKEFRPS